MAKIIIPTPLRKFTNNEATYHSGGKNVDESIKELVARFPGIRNHLYDESDNLRTFINIFVGDNDIRMLEKEKTPVSADTVVSIVPAIAGGC